MCDTVNNVVKLWCLGDVDVPFSVLHFFYTFCFYFFALAGCFSLLYKSLWFIFSY